MKLLVINGANINLLGLREPHIYGSTTYADLVRKVEAFAYDKGVGIEVRQSNHEGDLVDWIQEASGQFQGIIINAGGYTHTSVAILDALRAVQLPTVEVHISNPTLREEYRHFSFVAEYTPICYKGLGTDGYLRAIDYLYTLLSKPCDE